VIAVETRLVEQRIPADPGNPESREVCNTFILCSSLPSTQAQLLSASFIVLFIPVESLAFPDPPFLHRPFLPPLYPRRPFNPRQDRCGTPTVRTRQLRPSRTSTEERTSPSSYSPIGEASQVLCLHRYQHCFTLPSSFSLFLQLFWSLLFFSAPSGGTRDMYGEVLKFGAMIVDSLRTYKHPVFVYIPPGESRFIIILETA
jgi:Carboxyl transferase domain